MEIDLWIIFKNILQILWKFWPLWLILLCAGIIRLFFEWLDIKIDNRHIQRRFRKGEQWRSDQELIQQMRGMDPTEFEIYIADLFRCLGYRAEQVGGSHDGGIDVIAEKDGIKHYIQCKKYFPKHEVGSPEVRDFYGAIAHHLANGKGYFITTNKFTFEADKFAEDKPIELIDSFKLIKMVKLAHKNQILK